MARRQSLGGALRRRDLPVARRPQVSTVNRPASRGQPIALPPSAASAHRFRSRRGGSGRRTHEKRNRPQVGLIRGGTRAGCTLDPMATGRPSRRTRSVPRMSTCTPLSSTRPARCSSARSASDSPSATARCSTEDARGWVTRRASMSRTARTLIPARPVSSGWVKPARWRSWRSRSPRSTAWAYTRSRRPSMPRYARRTWARTVSQTMTQVRLRKPASRQLSRWSAAAPPTTAHGRVTTYSHQRGSFRLVVAALEQGGGAGDQADVGGLSAGSGRRPGRERRGRLPERSAPERGRCRPAMIGAGKRRRVSESRPTRRFRRSARAGERHR
jgi:hypothetical protein